MDELLNLLQTNARYSNHELATMLKTSEGDIAQRISKLEDDGIILKYSAVINQDRHPTQKDNVLAFIEVQVRPERETGFDAIAERIYKFPEVQSCYLMSGGYDLLVTVEGKTLQDVARFISEKLSTIDHVRGTQTHFLLKRYKENGNIFSVGDKVERLAVAA